MREVPPVVFAVRRLVKVTIVTVFWGIVLVLACVAAEVRAVVVFVAVLLSVFLSILLVVSAVYKPFIVRDMLPGVFMIEVAFLVNPCGVAPLVLGGMGVVGGLDWTVILVLSLV